MHNKHTAGFVRELAEVKFGDALGNARAFQIDAGVQLTLALSHHSSADPAGFGPSGIIVSDPP